MSCRNNDKVFQCLLLQVLMGGAVTCISKCRCVIQMQRSIDLERSVQVKGCRVCVCVCVAGCEWVCGRVSVGGWV